jgi:hypothetical protein
VWNYHPKHVERFPDMNKLCNVASCWIYEYIGRLLAAHPFLHNSRIKVKNCRYFFFFRLSKPCLSTHNAYFIFLFFISQPSFVYVTGFLTLVALANTFLCSLFRIPVSFPPYRYRLMSTAELVDCELSYLSVFIFCGQIW